MSQIGGCHMFYCMIPDSNFMIFDFGRPSNTFGAQLKVWSPTFRSQSGIFIMLNTVHSL